MFNPFFPVRFLRTTTTTTTYAFNTIDCIDRSRVEEEDAAAAANKERASEREKVILYTSSHTHAHMRLDEWYMSKNRTTIPCYVCFLDDKWVHRILQMAMQTFIDVLCSISSFGRNSCSSSLAFETNFFSLNKSVLSIISHSHFLIWRSDVTGLESLHVNTRTHTQEKKPDRQNTSGDIFSTKRAWVWSNYILTGRNSKLKLTQSKCEDSRFPFRYINQCIRCLLLWQTWLWKEHRRFLVQSSRSDSPKCNYLLASWMDLVGSMGHFIHSTIR